MKISKKDALSWFTFFAMLPEGEELLLKQQEIVYATLAQIERAVEKRREQMIAQIPGIKLLQGRSYYVGDEKKFPKGCISCLLGTGLSSIRKTNRCNIACKFCYNYGELDQIPPIGEGLWEIGGTKYYPEDLNLLLSIQKKPTGIAYVYLEPFMEIEEYYPMIQKFRAAGIHQHLYTNGTLATRENLKALAEAGLDELRFNLGASGCADGVIEAMAIAKEYIPQVGIETPMTPEFYEAFQQKKEQILSTGIDFINCAELHLNPNNFENYVGAPMYTYHLGYLSPIWSRDLTLSFMKQASQEGWDLVVHDCANRTKFARGINLGAKEGKWFGACEYGGEFEDFPYEAFLPVLEDETFSFVEEEELPAGYRPGELIF
ncbi:MAG TPA: radical SAM protein [Firmicutes bacterium]|nr:radical SAM protein [Bacillota bacterium]